MRGSDGGDGLVDGGFQRFGHAVELGIGNDEGGAETNDVADGAGAAAIEEDAALEAGADDALCDRGAFGEALERLAILDDLNAAQETFAANFAAAALWRMQPFAWVMSTARADGTKGQRGVWTVIGDRLRAWRSRGMAAEYDGQRLSAEGPILCRRSLFAVAPSLPSPKPRRFDTGRAHLEPRHGQGRSIVKVVVIGAGIVGVATAYELALRGETVTLIETREGAGLGTSYANGGQMSACEVAPWAGPEIPGLILRWLGRDDAPFRLRPKMDPDQWRWLLRFLLRCRSAARMQRIPPNLELALLTRERMASYAADFRDEGRSLDFDRRDERHPAHLRKRTCGSCRHDRDGNNGASGRRTALVDGGRMRRGRACAGASLQRGEIAGGLYSPSDASGDAHLFRST